VDVLNTCDYLLEEFACFFFGNPSFLNYIVKELSTLSELHDKIELSGRLYYLIQLNDIWVSNQLENMDLPGNSLNICHICNPTFLKNFYRDTLLSQLMSAFSHLAKSALAYLFFEIVISNNSSFFGNLCFLPIAAAIYLLIII
jgi:hypothetical protein